MKISPARQNKKIVHCSTGRVHRRLQLEPLESRSLLSVNVLTYHYDNASIGQNLGETYLTPSNVNVNTFGKLFSATTDGQAYSSPLYMAGVNISTPTVSGLHNVVYQATENDSLYAIDADTGAQLWKDSFLTPGPGVTSVVPVPAADVGAADLSPMIGITSTPVIDPATNTLYLTAKTKEVVGTNTHYIYRLHAIDVTTGNETLGGPAVIGDVICNNATSATPTFTIVSGPVINGTGDGSTTVHFNALRQLQRPALTFANGDIYVAFGSNGDVTPYYGWVLGYNAQTLALDGVFNAAPNGNAPNGGQAAVWQSGGRIAVDASGALYFMTGNGTFDSTLNAAGFPNKGDYGDSFVKLVLDPTTNIANMNQNGWGFKVADYFTQFNQDALRRADIDVGSGAPLLLPDSVGTPLHPHLLVGGGKDGTIFLIDRDNMGHFDPAGNHVVQEVDGALRGSFDTPAFYNNTIYYVESANSLPAAGGLAKSFSISNATLSTTPTSISAAADNYFFPGATPIVSADGSTNGVTWTVEKKSNQLRAYDANSFGTLLYTSAQAANSRDSLGFAVKFAAPIEANAKVYVGTSGKLVAYGLLPNLLPAAPSNVQAVSVGTTSATLTWNDNSTNETGFHVYRQTGSGAFGLVATLPANGTSTDSFADSNLQPSTLYNYHIQAFDALGAAGYGSIGITTNSIGPPQADLQITNTDGQTNAAPGAPLTYTIVVSNAGPNGVTGAGVADTFPGTLSGVTFTAAATGGAAGFTASGSGDINDTANLPSGSTITYTVQATLSAAATGTLANTATVGVPAGVTDNNLANNSATDTDTVAPQADLQITNTDGQTNAAPGALLTYTIVVSNAGPNDVTGAGVADTFPATLSGVTFTAAATGGATGFSASGSGNINDTANLPSGSTITYTVQATLSAAATGTLTNTATVGVPAGIIDPVSANNSATDTDTIGTVPTLSFPNGFAGAAGQFSFNGTPAKIVGSNLQLTDGGANEAASIFALTPVNVAQFSTQFNFQLLAGTSPTADGITFTIQRLGLNALGGSGGALGYATTIINSVAVKFDLFNNAGEGPDSTGLYTNGAQPNAINSINLTGTGIDLHSGHIFNAAMIYDGTTLKVTITDTVTMAAATQSYPVNIPTIVGASTAFVGFTGGTGGLTAIQNVLNWTYAPGAVTPQTDLQITNTDGQTNAAPGALLTYTIVATNAGPNDVTGVSVADAFPATLTGVTFTAVATGGATGFTASGSGNISDTVNLPSGSTITYTVQATLSAAATGTLANTASVTAPAGVTDTNPANNSATDTDTVASTPQTDLQITNTDGQTNAAPGALLTYTIVATNAGPNNVTGAAVADTFPAALTGLTFTAVATGGATGFAASGSGNINDTANLPSGSKITYTVHATLSAAATGTLANTATVTAPASVTDSNPANNSATDTDTVAVTPTLNFPNGFAGTASQFAFNGASAKIVGTNLQLTDGGASEAASIFASTKVGVTSFTTQFAFQLLPGTSSTADGLTFTIQGVATTARGGSGGNLGYGGITKSVAVKFDLFNNAGEGPNSTGLYTNGALPTSANSINLTGTGIDLHSGHVFRVNMTYAGTTLQVTITDTVTLAAATQTYTVNIPTIVGASTAYVGLTGGTGGLTAVQNILNWTYTGSTQAALAVPLTVVAAPTSGTQPTTNSGLLLVHQPAAGSASSQSVSSGSVSSSGQHLLTVLPGRHGTRGVPSRRSAAGADSFQLRIQSHPPR
jgi:uncharacterized repeat protein (TIGR01451 family)